MVSTQAHFETGHSGSDTVADVSKPTPGNSAQGLSFVDAGLQDIKNLAARAVSAVDVATHLGFPSISAAESSRLSADSSPYYNGRRVFPPYGTSGGAGAEGLSGDSKSTPSPLSKADAPFLPVYPSDVRKPDPADLQSPYNADPRLRPPIEIPAPPPMPPDHTLEGPKDDPRLKPPIEIPAPPPMPADHTLEGPKDDPRLKPPIEIPAPPPMPPDHTLEGPKDDPRLRTPADQPAPTPLPSKPIAEGQAPEPPRPGNPTRDGEYKPPMPEYVPPLTASKPCPIESTH